MVELFLRFLVVGATAFGGGGTALPLVDRITVAETGWLTPHQFAVGVGFAYATPGPILILAAFVGYHVAGIAGALVGTVGVFAVPVILAAGSAGMVAQLNRHARFRGFGRFAAAAAAHRNRAHHPELSSDGVDHELGLCVVDVMPAPLGNHVARVGQQAPQLALGGL